MKYNGFKFKDLKEFQSVQMLAQKNGIETVVEFNQFLQDNYS